MSLNRGAFTIFLLTMCAAAMLSGLYVVRMGKGYLPDFDEGATQLNMYSLPGTSLATSTGNSQMADRQLLKLVHSPDNPQGPIKYFTCRTGRAENDEHIMGVNTNEYVITLHPDSLATREEIIQMVDDAAAHLPNVEREVEQPIAHLISHMISGVTAQIAIKLFGDDLNTLVRKGAEIRDAVAEIDGIAPPVVEQQQVIPQLIIQPHYKQLAFYKLSANDVFELVETAMQGVVVSQMIEGERNFDVVMRFHPEHRDRFEQLRRIPIELPDGGSIPLSTVADVYQYGGPNTINREDARRRIVVRVNTRGRDLESAVNEIQSVIDDKVELPSGYYVQLGGQFEAQQSATQRILWLSGVALVVVFVVLYSTYSSISIVLQILLALPMAFIGGVMALWITDQSLTVAAMVGFISLGGIAARNGLLLVSTYLKLAGENEITPDIIVHGSLNRMTPVLMTTLTTGIALLPLILAGHLPGREILFPVATVIVGGLITSTVCEFLIRPGLFYYCSGIRPTRIASEGDLIPSATD